MNKRYKAFIDLLGFVEIRSYVPFETFIISLYIRIKVGI